MSRLPHRIQTITAALATLTAALGGCTATADMSYGEYQFGPGYQTERVYERRVYGDTSQGLGGEACQNVVRRQVNEFGDVVVRDSRICDDTAPGYVEVP